MVTGAKQIRQPIQLLITLTPDGQLKVEGATQNRLIAYGMLQMAIEVISKSITQKEIKVEQNQSKVLLVPDGTVIPNVKGLH